MFLLFEVGADRYAIDAEQLVEVLPLLKLKQMPHAPAGLAGVIDYHGSPVPVVDVNEAMIGQPARRRLSTRTIICHVKDGAGRQHRLGLIAERATSTVVLDAATFVDSGVSNRDAPYLGPVVADPHGLIQWVNVQRLLPESTRQAIFEP